MNQTDFFWGYLPFWVVTYGLSLVGWLCVGRWALSFFMPAVQPQNYIWRSFVWMTAWAVAAASFVTPSSIGPRWIPLVASFWLFWIRLGFYMTMARLGQTPNLPGAS